MAKGCRKFLKQSRKMALKPNNVKSSTADLSPVNGETLSAFSMYKSKTPDIGMKPKKRRGRPKKKPNSTLPKTADTENATDCMGKEKTASAKPKFNMVALKEEPTSLKEELKPDTMKSLKKKLDSPIVGILKKSKTVDNLDNGVDVDLENSNVLRTACMDSRKEGREVFEWLIAPHSLDVFLSDFWEKKPLHISRRHDSYYKFILTIRSIDKILRQEVLKFTENIDITSYDNGVRETHNPVGRALPHVVWDFYTNKCSVRILNPQTYFPRIHTLNASLQEYFNCFVGANLYLTPPDSQGFAPHYDDIEAFVLQIEGKKLWKIYAPLSQDEVLPRISSKNFTPEEVGNPIMEVVLEAGDVLYFPRGFIHQATTIEGEYSLHVTISTYQKHSWADYFEKLLPQALETAIQNDVEFRKGVPFDLYQNLGLIHSDSKSPRRKEIFNQINTLLGRLTKHLPCDYAADEVFKGFVHDALPPIIPENERHLTVFGDSDRINVNGVLKNRVEIQLDTEVKILRANILRMVTEEDSIRLYHSIENSKVYHENEIQFLEIDDDVAPCVETLINTYPNFIAVKDLNIDNDDSKLQLVGALWERGLVKCKYPLEFIN
ncbi:bifunctional lysine-specific demethylase and histidyl-hydroxylase NO66 isoform X2 [Arctopsyche grandis]|uniref:bifunctional lysine-specific demethylase and histidyl-hydroxylase NO66 isoform X2 n=1 Tax=Arctopsyche grandis TaxID=121162 RepID=UPI00406D9CDD